MKQVLRNAHKVIQQQVDTHSRFMTVTRLISIMVVLIFKTQIRSLYLHQMA